MAKWQIEINMLLTLNGDDECEEEERGEDEGGEGFVRESHLVNSFNSCGKDEIKQCFTFTFRLLGRTCLSGWMLTHCQRE